MKYFICTLILSLFSALATAKQTDTLPTFMKRVYVEPLKTQNFEAINLVSITQYYDTSLVVLPDWLFKCKNIKTLDISNQPNIHIDSVCQSLGYFKKLTFLGFGNITFDTLPKSFYDLNNLSGFSFFRSNVGTISPRIAELCDLETIIISYCDSLDIAKIIKELSVSKSLRKKLKRLDITHCTLTSELPKEIALFRNLEMFDTGGTLINQYPKEILTLKKMLKYEFGYGKGLKGDYQKRIDEFKKSCH
jgi:Leucine-rich repeat (LRR) protein